MGSGESDGRQKVLIDVVRAPGWRNDRAETGVRFERGRDGIPRVAIERPFLSGAFAPTASGFEGSFTLAGEGDALLDGIMSLGLALVCERKGDLLLHASAVERGGRAWVFLGGGGAGKTTIATELSRGRATLCVDKAIVSSRPDGLLRVHATPFGEGLDPSWTPKSAAIAGLYFIEQAEAHEVARLSRWEAARGLLGHAIAPSREPESVQRTVEAIGRLVDLDAAFRLRFRKDDGFWPLVDGVSAGG